MKGSVAPTVSSHFLPQYKIVAGKVLKWLLGDNFYDQNGVITDLFFTQLSLDVKRKFSAMVIGNHDMWVGGGPSVGDEYDQHGIGMMQYYALDPHASLYDDVNFLDFGLDPDKVQKWNTSLNTASNLVWYNMIGDVGFIGVSGSFWKANVASMRKGLCGSRFVGSVRCCGRFHLLHVAHDECQPNGNVYANAADNATDANDDVCAASGECRQ